MTTSIKNIIPRQYAPNAQTTVYTATNCRTVIDSFSATNQSAANVTISVNLVASGGTAGADNRVVKDRSIQPNETYIFPELTGQSLEPNGFISVIASSATSLTLSASGREIT